MVLTDYTEEYDAEIEKLDGELFCEIKRYKDVLPESICVALKNGIFAGVGFLVATPALAAILNKEQKKTNLEVEKKDSNTYFLTGEYKAVPGTDYEIEVSAAILEDMKESLRIFRNEHEELDVVLRLFCNGTDLAYLEFLMSNGFEASGIMPVFSKKLKKTTKKSGSKNADEISLPDDSFRIIDLAEHQDLIPQYMKAYKSSFGTSLSRTGIDFRLKEKGAGIFCVEKDGKIISAVAIRKSFDDTIFMENVFVAAKYRKHGFASCLIKYLCRKYSMEGIKKCELTIHGDNQPAVMLYLNNGFEITGTSILMHMRAPAGGRKK